jgi:RNA polymerase sigma factor (sigma-70 family)
MPRSNPSKSSREMPGAPFGPTTRADPALERTEADRFVVAHLPLAERLARRHTSLYSDWADLFQEACLALVEVVRQSAPLPGGLNEPRVEALSVIWIRHRLALAHARRACGAWSVPDHALADWLKLNREQRRLRAILGREPAAHEVARAAGITAARLADLVQIDVPLASLDSFAQGCDEHDSLTSTDEARRLALSVRDEVAQLPEPERTIVARYYGIGCRRSPVRVLARDLHMSPRSVITVRQHGLSLLRSALSGGG